MAQRTQQFTATRHKSYADAVNGPETYCLIFTHTEGDQHIAVKFRDGWEHDVINVFDNATQTTRVHNWDQFRKEVADYMETVTQSGLRLDWVNAS